MHRDLYLPEGSLLHTEKNIKALSSLQSLMLAMENRTILEGKVILCDAAHNLVVDLGAYTGIIPRSEAAIGIEEGQTREIAVISRVGKAAAFHITGIETSPDGKVSVMLSRKSAQQEAMRYFLNNFKPGDIVPAKITHLEPFGAFVDIGCGNVSLIGIENISVSRISHPSDRFEIGQDIKAVVLYIDEANQRITLTHRELLGTWSENISRFEPGQTVRGVVRGIEDYGVFVELAPNLSGLAERRDNLNEGDTVSVFIKNIAPDKMKIKLIIIDVFPNEKTEKISEKNYFIDGEHIGRWQYSPELCGKKNIFTEFV